MEVNQPHYDLLPKSTMTQIVLDLTNLNLDGTYGLEINYDFDPIKQSYDELESAYIKLLQEKR